MQGVTDRGAGDESDLIRIELRLDGSSPIGNAIAAHGGTRSFTGWVGLMSAVDALVAKGNTAHTEEEQ